MLPLAFLTLEYRECKYHDQLRMRLFHQVVAWYDTENFGSKRPLNSEILLNSYTIQIAQVQLSGLTSDRPEQKAVEVAGKHPTFNHLQANCFFDFRLSNPSWMVIWMVAWKACFHIRCKWDGLTTYQHSEQPTLSGASLTWRLETFRVPPSWNMNGNSQSKTVHLGNSPLNHLHELSDCLIIDVSTLFWTWPSKTAEA